MRNLPYGLLAFACVLVMIFMGGLIYLGRSSTSSEDNTSCPSESVEPKEKAFKHTISAHGTLIDFDMERIAFSNGSGISHQKYLIFTFINDEGQVKVFSLYYTKERNFDTEGRFPTTFDEFEIERVEKDRWIIRNLSDITEPTTTVKRSEQ